MTVKLRLKKQKESKFVKTYICCLCMEADGGVRVFMWRMTEVHGRVHCLRPSTMEAHGGEWRVMVGVPI